VSSGLIQVTKYKQTQSSIAGGDVQRLQVLNAPSLTWYLGRWGEASDENCSSGIGRQSCRHKLPMRARSSWD
jgi:hypothetical protein